ncbi:hypothetical protein [Acidithiobacillus acidisediminis]|jgi:hypothetical protein|uniref:hypothetical protein n=1 Tax=Acidithiobacillus acidisediminis TaxID=2937799 RepID=UPI00200C19FB|nr:hypothetical protein [Acidithiobacillus sp. S30A2]
MALVLLLLVGSFWMGQFFWFPDGDSLLRLLLKDADLPKNLQDLWAIDHYRATFSPDVLPLWLKQAMVYLSVFSWLTLLIWTVLASLSVAGLYLKSLGPWPAWVAFVTWAISQALLLTAFLWETFCFWKKKVPLDIRLRKAQWLAAHPKPPGNWPAGRFPWWFWLDRDALETVFRAGIFLGGFLASAAVVLYFAYLAKPRVLTASGFWELLLLLVFAVFESVVPLTLWLYHLDWSRRDRTLLLFWASRQ